MYHCTNTYGIILNLLKLSNRLGQNGSYKVFITWPLLVVVSMSLYLNKKLLKFSIVDTHIARWHVDNSMQKFDWHCFSTYS